MIQHSNSRQRATHVNGSLQTALHARALKGNIHVRGLLPHQRGDLPGELELRVYAFGPLHGHHDAGVREAPVDRPLHPLGVDVRDDDLPRAKHLAHGAAQQAHGAGAQHQHRGVLFRAFGQQRAVARVHGHGEGLDQGAELEGHRGRELVRVAGRVGDGLLEGALGVGVGLGAGAEGHVPADVVPPRGAQLAGAAGQADLEGDVVAGPEVRDGGADGGDDARGLVAEGEGLADLDVAVAEVGEVVQVGAAEAGGLDVHEDVGGGQGGESAFFLGQCQGCKWFKGRLGYGDELTYYPQIFCSVEH